MATRSLPGYVPIAAPAHRARDNGRTAATRWAPGLESMEPPTPHTTWLQDFLLNPHAADIVGYLRAARSAGGPVLDLGAGAGRLTVPFAHHGFRVEAVDRDAAGLTMLREWAARGGRRTEQSVITTCTELSRLQLEGTYGFVMLAGAMVAALSPCVRAALLDEVTAHLHPGGALALDFTAHHRAELLGEPERSWTFRVPRFDGIDETAFARQRFEPSTMREEVLFRTEQFGAQGVLRQEFGTSKWIVDPDALAIELRQAGLRILARDSRPLDARTDSVFLLCERRDTRLDRRPVARRLDIVRPESSIMA
ncbi:class I SAM-dependent methyltransferase [Kitasatospora sp. GP82]|uniref:class I SAM-dependent methyltransferase n=1 Tax=Kitasatospora sp. GP82 TaxID=3035089 RepID=UPI00247563AB|nr:class I SAM-dependent methyltransferase [Kitasatospora sp. GP82]MDH6125703.1 SAM-dependent methyltransferase [Kitasatospora sp. GP82]